MCSWLAVPKNGLKTAWPSKANCHDDGSLLFSAGGAPCSGLTSFVQSLQPLHKVGVFLLLKTLFLMN